MQFPQSLLISFLGSVTGAFAQWEFRFVVYPNGEPFFLHVIRAHIVVAMEWVAVSESVGWSVAVAKFSRWQNGDTASAVRGREAASERANKRGRELPIKAADGRKEGGREGRTGLALALVAARTSPSVPRKKTASSSLADFALFEFDGRAAAATDGRREGEGAPVPPARARSSCTSWRRLARRRRRSRPGRLLARRATEVCGCFRRLRCLHSRSLVEWPQASLSLPEQF